VSLLQKIGSIKNNNKKVIENFSYLSLIQVFNLVLPLVIYPYLIRVLGKDLYGTVIFAQTIATYFSIFINFGFNISGAKEIAINREDLEKTSEIFSSILTIKSIFWIISILVLIFSLLLLQVGSEDIILYIFSFLICINDVLFPQWFFQGIEKMKYNTIINLVIKVLFIILILFFVQTKEQYLLVPLLNGIGGIVGGGISLYIVLKKEQVSFYIPKLSILKKYLKDSFPLFASDAIISVKDRFNYIFLGAFLGMDKVAIYDIGIKILALVMIPISIINNALYPKMSIEKNKTLLKKLMTYSFIFYLIICILIQPLVPFIIKIFAGGMESAILPTRILLIAPIIFCLGCPLAQNGLIVFDKYKSLLIGMFLTTLFYLLSVFLGYYFDLLLNVFSFAIITVLVYLFECIYRYMACRKHSII
jgi:polysaccharide biosynthesis protein